MSNKIYTAPQLAKIGVVLTTLAALIIAGAKLYFSAALFGTLTTALVASATIIGLHCWFVFAVIMLIPYHTKFAAAGALGALVTALLV